MIRIIALVLFLLQSDLYLPLMTNRANPPSRCVAKSSGSIWDYQRIFGIDCYLTWGTNGVVNETPLQRQHGIWKLRYATCDMAYYNWGGIEGKFSFWDVLDEVPVDYGGWLATFNEPDLPPPQCNGEPSRIAWAWHLLERARPAAMLLCPAVSHIDYHNGWAWYKAWMRQHYLAFGEFPDCAAGAVHWYDNARNPALMLQSYKTMLCSFGNCNVPIFITEYGAVDGGDLCEMLRAWENDPAVVAHFYYSGDHTALSLLEDGEITATGEAYLACIAGLESKP